MPFFDVKAKRTVRYEARTPDTKIRSEVPSDMTAEQAHQKCKLLHGFLGVNVCGGVVELVFDGASDKKHHKQADKLVRKAGPM